VKENGFAISAEKKYFFKNSAVKRLIFIARYNLLVQQHRVPHADIVTKKQIIYETFVSLLLPCSLCGPYFIQLLQKATGKQ
jgi:hypothetical protein